MNLKYFDFKNIKVDRIIFIHTQTEEGGTMKSLVSWGRLGYIKFGNHFRILLFAFCLQMVNQSVSYFMFLMEVKDNIEHGEVN
jgi:hypothetical protein